MSKPMRLTPGVMASTTVVTPVRLAYNFPGTDIWQTETLDGRTLNFRAGEFSPYFRSPLSQIFLYCEDFTSKMGDEAIKPNFTTVLINHIDSMTDYSRSMIEYGVDLWYNSIGYHHTPQDQQV